MAGRFEGKRAIVTGASGGVGRSTAELLEEEGATVVGLDLAAGDGVLACDVSDEGSVRAAVAQAAEQLGGIDVVVNVAGIDQFRRFEDLDTATWQRHLGVNLTGPMLVTHAALPHLRESRGNVVTISSIAGLRAQPYQASYCASKAGVIMLMKSLALELAADGIRVNTIAPGLIDTPIYGEGERADAFKAHLGQSVLFPSRLGSGEELAYMVMELITNPYMNGEVIRVDGGIRMPPK